MKSLIQKIKFLRAFVVLVKDPIKTERIFEIADIARNQRKGAGEKSVKVILENLDFQALHQSNYSPMIEIKSLRSLRPESFGRAVAEFLDRNGFEPNGFPKVFENGPLDYLVDRIRQTHDLWHVLTGYDTSIGGELGLQGFVFAQVQSPLSALILAGGLLHLILFKPLEVMGAFELIVEGLMRGKRSKNLMTLRLEDYWKNNLDDLRAELGLCEIRSPLLEQVC